MILTGLFGLMFASLPASAADFRLCTGASSGVYYAAGHSIRQMAGNSLPITVVETGGTIDNLRLVLDETKEDGCDAFIGQPDGPVYVARQSPAKAKLLRQVGSLHREYLHVLCSKDSGVDDLGDIAGGKYSLAIGEPGSGAWLIWQNIITEDKSYESVPVTNEGGILALSAVATNTTTCMLVPAGLRNGTVNEADQYYGDALVLADANDKDFNDATDINGKPLYSYSHNISGKVYPKSFNYWSDVQTISWQAGVYVNTEKVSQKELSTFIQAVSRAATGIRAEYGN